MPLHRAKSKSKKAVNKAVSRNIDEMYHQPGSRMKALAKKYGPKKMQQIRVAAAERAAHGNKKKGRSPRKRR
ncbi:MAG: hypothetical protein KGL39_12920 [Patescibacteria group bacterium]|nr:hypothetical protein [Patescibacteria group bacterium]